MTSRNILAIGYYKQDIYYLIEILKGFCSEYNYEAKLLITSEGDLKEQATEIIRRAGYELIESPTNSQPYTYSRNPFRTYDLLRKYNINSSQALLEKSAAEVILCTSNLAGGWFYPTARAKNIPSLYLQWTEIHSLKVHKLWWHAEEAYFDQRKPFFYRWRRKILRPIEKIAGVNAKRWPMDIGTTCVAVQAPFYKQMAIEAGISSKKIVVTGNPQCDEIYAASNFGPDNHSKIVQKLGLRLKTRFILYMRDHVGRLYHLDPELAIRAQKDAIHTIQAAAPEYTIVVKLHPKEGEEEAKQVQSIDPKIVIVKDELQTGELIAASEMVVATTSSTLLWAVGIDRPAISVFLLPDFPEWRLRRHWSGVEKVDTLQDLAVAVKRNLFDKTHQKEWALQRQACRNEFLMLDGKCTERVVKQLGQLVEGN